VALVHKILIGLVVVAAVLGHRLALIELPELVEHMVLVVGLVEHMVLVVGLVEHMVLVVGLVEHMVLVVGLVEQIELVVALVEQIELVVLGQNLGELELVLVLVVGRSVGMDLA